MKKSVSSIPLIINLRTFLFRYFVICGKKRYRHLSTSVPNPALCCRSYFVFKCPVASSLGLFSSSVPGKYRLDFFASQSLIVLWTHPLHFISCQHVKRSFHRSSLAFIETQLGGILRFHWTRPFTLFTIYIRYLVQVLFHLFTAYASLRLITSDLPLLLKPVGFFLFQH